MYRVCGRQVTYLNHNSDRGESYFELLRANRDFRKLWVGLIISQAGDWFNIIALFSLLTSLTGSNVSIAYIFIIRMLPFCFLGPFAGVIADRYNRKIIMILADLIRCLVILSYILVRSEDLVWVIYALATVEVLATSFFEMAKLASIPNIVTSTQLVSANVLLGISWSCMLALGAALGGYVTDTMGHNTAFAVNASTFLVSAAFISRVNFPTSVSERKASSKGSFKRIFGVSELVESASYIRSNFNVALLLMVKAGWGLGGGLLLLLIILGKQVFPLGQDGSTSVGLLYASRGVGAILGPVIGRAVAGSSDQAMRKVIAFAFFACPCFYLLLGSAQSLVDGILYVLAIHAAGNMQWIFSTTLLQKAIPDYLRGRVLALDLAFFMLAMSISIYLTAFGLDHMGMTARSLAVLLSVSTGIYGVCWLFLQRASRRNSKQDSKSCLLGMDTAGVPDCNAPPP